MYNWFTIETVIIAPPGWHVPTDEDWDLLLNFLIANNFNWDDSTTGNKVAKSMATKTGWDSSDSTGHIGNNMTDNNSSGFSALPRGTRHDHGGSFIGQGKESA